MTCWQCGTPLPPDVGFCRACGAFVRPRSMPAATLTVAPDEQAPAVGFPPRASGAARSEPWSIAPVVTHAPAPPISSRSVAPVITGDVLAAAGAVLTLLSLFLTWYKVTLTPLGVQFYESIERAFLSRLFPQISDSLGSLRGPLTFSVPALGSSAGGWRWAILVVSLVVVLEVLLAISSSTFSQSSPDWPHGGVLLVLSVADLILVIAAFFRVPYGSVPSAYVTAVPSVGVYLALFAAFLAFAGAVAVVARGHSDTMTSRKTL